MPTRDRLAAAWGITWFPYQVATLDAEQGSDAASLRACLYYRTGAGKTYTALALLAQAGVQHALVVAPLSTHGQWTKHAGEAGITIEIVTHQKYRMKTYKVPRAVAVILDEFHMLGGQQGAGWTKLRVHARHLKAPLIILSATPNYNDAERVYCVAHILDPVASKGGYIEWIYRNCETEANPFGKLPNILGFVDGRAAKEHLAELPHVYYVEDENEDFLIADIELPTEIPWELEQLGMDRRTRRIVASRMEYVSSSRKHQLLDDDGTLREEVYEILAVEAGKASTPVLVFCARAEIAIAAHYAAVQHGARSGLVIYHPDLKRKEVVLEAFKQGELDVLFGTATMSTGVDGLDKVCDMLILLDDTDDASLRRQVIGRILPRGSATDVSKKQVIRLCLGS